MQQQQQKKTDGKHRFTSCNNKTMCSGWRALHFILGVFKIPDAHSSNAMHHQNVKQLDARSKICYHYTLTVSVSLSTTRYLFVRFNAAMAVIMKLCCLQYDYGDARLQVEKPTGVCAGVYPPPGSCHS